MNHVTINQHFGVSGHFQLVPHDGNGTATRGENFTADFPNMILNSGLDQLPVYGPATVIQYTHVGTSSVAPVETQTSLVAPVASTANAISTTYTYVDGVAPYMQTVRVLRFAVGAAAGNLAEIGMARDLHTAGVPAYCRALILDGGGAPTVLVVLATEALDVVYTQRLYLPTNTQTGSQVIAGTTHSFTSMLSRVVADGDVEASGWMGQNWPGDNMGTPMWSAPIYSAISNFGTATVGITGTEIGTATWTDNRVAYVGGTYSATIEAKSTIETIPTGNIAGGKVRWAISGPATKIQFSPVIPIDATQSIKFVVKVTFGRYVP